MEQKKRRLFVRIMCIVLAGLMTLSVATYIFYAFAGLF